MEKKESLKHVIHRVHFDMESGETLWALSSLSSEGDDYYIGMSTGMMPPNHGWQVVKGVGKYPAPGLVFYNRAEKFMHNSMEPMEPTIPSHAGSDKERATNFTKEQKSEELREGSGNILSILNNAPYAWRKRNAPWVDTDLESVVTGGSSLLSPSSPLPRMSDAGKMPEFVLSEIEKIREEATEKLADKELTIQKLEEFGVKWQNEIREWKTKYRKLEKKHNKMGKKKEETERRAITLYERLQDMNDGYYEFWLSNKIKGDEIERIGGELKTQRKRLFEVKKKVFMQRRREEELMEKIREMKRSSRRASYATNGIFENLLPERLYSQNLGMPGEDTPSYGRVDSGSVVHHFLSGEP